MLKKGNKVGRTINTITLHEKLHITEQITDRDLLLYLGLTGDNNPLYIQHDYAATTPYKKPVVPAILLNGLLCSVISKYLPGPGAYVLAQQLQFLAPVYHYEIIELTFEVIAIALERNELTIAITIVNEEKVLVAEGEMVVVPPLKSITA